MAEFSVVHGRWSFTHALISAEVAFRLPVLASKAPICIIRFASVIVFLAYHTGLNKSRGLEAGSGGLQREGLV